jgi:hypothetical protein
VALRVALPSFYPGFLTLPELQRQPPWLVWAVRATGSTSATGNGGTREGGFGVPALFFSLQGCDPWEIRNGLARVNLHPIGRKQAGWPTVEASGKLAHVSILRDGVPVRLERLECRRCRDVSDLQQFEPIRLIDPDVPNPRPLDARGHPS